MKIDRLCLVVGALLACSSISFATSSALAVPIDMRMSDPRSVTIDAPRQGLTLAASVKACDDVGLAVAFSEDPGTPFKLHRFDMAAVTVAKPQTPRPGLDRLGVRALQKSADPALKVTSITTTLTRYGSPGGAIHRGTS